MALCTRCLRCTHNEPLINGVCKVCYEEDEEEEDSNVNIKDNHNIKIWKAKLVLYYTDEDTYKTKFFFDLMENEYKINEYSKDEWTYFEDWVMDRIPMKMIAEKYYDNYNIIQGFDHELNADELIRLEADMKTFMLKHLNYDKEKCLEQFDKKFKAIK